MSERWQLGSRSDPWRDGDALNYLELQRRTELETEVSFHYDLRSLFPVSLIEKAESEFYRFGKPIPALEKAVAAFQCFQTNRHKYKRGNRMSQVAVKNETKALSMSQKFGLTETQLDLVKRTVAKNATDDELELFFYRAKELELNPLMPGQIYFLKFGASAGTIIIGLDGFRLRAQRTGQLSGIKRGVIRNDKGECIGGWADVYRKDWDHPAHEEVSLSEYADYNKKTWKNMPETMIKKVAEVACLRLAFPDHLSSVYLEEEMDQAQRAPKEVGNESIRKPSTALLKQLVELSELKGLTIEELKSFMKSCCGVETSQSLTMDQYNILWKALVEMKNREPGKEESEWQSGIETSLAPHLIK